MRMRARLRAVHCQTHHTSEEPETERRRRENVFGRRERRGRGCRVGLEPAEGAEDGDSGEGVREEAETEIGKEG